MNDKGIIKVISIKEKLRLMEYFKIRRKEC